MTRTIPGKPQLLAEVSETSAATLELRSGEVTFEVEPEGEVTAEQLGAVLRSTDGSASLAEISAKTGVAPDQLTTILLPAQIAGLLADRAEPAAEAPMAVLGSVEHVVNRLLEELVFDGPFWRAILDHPEQVEPHVYYGFGLENWFFLSRECEFDSAILAYPSSDAIRTMANDFYHEEHRHDDIVVRAFEGLGIARADLVSARPLSTTSGLIKLLSWWARTDPLFFIATIGILEGRLEQSEEEGATYDSFLRACGIAGIPAHFVEPMRQHAKVNAGHDHGSVSREFFAALPPLPAGTTARLVGKAHLFVEAYAEFFNGVLEYYGNAARPLVRTLSASTLITTAGVDDGRS
ncbi:hypothetical protein [Nocardia sp. NPDC049149]|uniref:hypothetical protein n=1 Tax=Nocardia sp. NPDC049149 TaxID=3364315 RepID=UPI00371BB9C1